VALTYYATVYVRRLVVPNLSVIIPISFKEHIPLVPDELRGVRSSFLLPAQAVSTIRMGDNQCAQQYHRLLTKGIKAENARLTVARAIVSTLYAMWRDGTAYQLRT